MAAKYLRKRGIWDDLRKKSPGQTTESWPIISSDFQPGLARVLRAHIYSTFKCHEEAKTIEEKIVSYQINALP